MTLIPISSLQSRAAVDGKIRRIRVRITAYPKVHECVSYSMHIGALIALSVDLSKSPNANGSQHRTPGPKPVPPHMSVRPRCGFAFPDRCNARRARSLASRRVQQGEEVHGVGSSGCFINVAHCRGGRPTQNLSTATRMAVWILCSGHSWNSYILITKDLKTLLTTGMHLHDSTHVQHLWIEGTAAWDQS